MVPRDHGAPVPGPAEQLDDDPVRLGVVGTPKDEQLERSHGARSPVRVKGV